MLIEKFNLTISKYYPHGATQFAKLYFKNKPINAIEIGSYRGDNAKSILKELNIKRLILIDPYENYKIVDGKEELKKLYQGNYLQEAKNKAVKRFRNNEKVKMIFKNSIEALSDIVNERFDFVYIDGNHAYDFVIKDMESYWKLLNKEGLLCGDDIDQLEVFRAVRDFSKKVNKDVRIWGLNWIIVKGKANDNEEEKEN